MEIPGIALIHCVITDDCRKMRTSKGAIDEALRRIERDLTEVINDRGHEKGINYRVVLLVDSPSSRQKEQMKDS